jgi:hypothetical protein
MGDHSWRTKLIWSAKNEWSPEEQQASDGGKFDARPAYIVKLPEQQEAMEVSQPFDAVNTRMLFSAIMTKQLATPEDLSSWVEMLRGKPGQKGGLVTRPVPPASLLEVLPPRKAGPYLFSGEKSGH